MQMSAEEKVHVVVDNDLAPVGSGTLTTPSSSGVVQVTNLVDASLAEALFGEGSDAPSSNGFLSMQDILQGRCRFKQVWYVHPGVYAKVSKSIVGTLRRMDEHTFLGLMAPFKQMAGPYARRFYCSFDIIDWLYADGERDLSTLFHAGAFHIGLPYDAQLWAKHIGVGWSCDGRLAVKPRAALDRLTRHSIEGVNFFKLPSSPEQLASVLEWDRPYLFDSCGSEYGLCHMHDEGAALVAAYHWSSGSRQRYFYLSSHTTIRCREVHDRRTVTLSGYRTPLVLAEWLSMCLEFLMAHFAKTDTVLRFPVANPISKTWCQYHEHPLFFIFEMTATTLISLLTCKKFSWIPQYRKRGARPFWKGLLKEGADFKSGNDAVLEDINRFFKADIHMPT
jgi:hypothetical protein